ncbi:unnamed protein product [Bemisia tabaci]|uniref:Tudor domain-containing protein n=1 Tax=Bemisia tabaci TaxID=7038 RepID=A0A9N9ZZQ7_BEMTA|nr:unnamed protein product [Bemisia tabaci]
MGHQSRSRIMEDDIILKLQAVVDECDAAFRKIESLKQQCTHFLTDCSEVGQSVFSQHNYTKIDEQLSKVLSHFEQIKSTDLCLKDEVFSYAIPHHPKDSSSADPNNCPLYDMEYVTGEKPWLFMLKYIKDDRWRILKRALMKNLSENSLQPYGRTPEHGSHVLFCERNRVSRGLVLQILPPQADGIESVKLLDVDTNAIKFVQSNQLYHVNLIAASVHSQILHCCLENESNPAMWPGELNNIFADALRGSLLRVRLLGKHIEDDIETTFVPTYSVRILALKTDDNVVIDINEWILNHVFPALVQSKGSFQCIDLKIFDPYRYCLSDSEAEEILKGDSDDCLADFDDYQIDTMSVTSEVTNQSVFTHNRTSTPVSFGQSQKIGSLSPHAPVFTCFGTSTKSSSVETDNNVDTKSAPTVTKPASEVPKPEPTYTEPASVITKPSSSEDIDTSSVASSIISEASDGTVRSVISSLSSADVKDVTLAALLDSVPDVSNILSHVFSKDNCHDIDEDIQDEEASAPASQHETQISSQVVSERDNVERNSPIPVDPADVITANKEQPVTKPHSVQIEPKERQTKTTVKSHTAPLKSSQPSQQSSTSFTNDPLLFSRPPSTAPPTSYPPGFGTTRPQYHQSQYHQGPPPHSMVRPPIYGSYQGASIYMSGQYQSPMFYNYNQTAPPQFNMNYYAQQPRFNPPPMINPQQVFNPMINSVQISQHPPISAAQQSTYQHLAQLPIVPVASSQNSQPSNSSGSNVIASEMTNTKINRKAKVMEKVKETISCKNSNDSNSSKDSLNSVESKGKDTPNPSRNSSLEPTKKPSWSVNDLGNSSKDPSTSTISKPLSTIVPTFYIPASKDCIPKDTTLSGILTYYVSPQSFYIRLNNEKSQDGDRLTQEMADYYSDPKNIIEFMSKDEAKSALGDYAACLWSTDCKWYRVELQDWNVDSESVRVFYIDYGNYENAHWTSLQPLTKKFAKPEKLAIKCALGRVRPVTSSGWEIPVHDFIKSLYRPEWNVLIKVEDTYNSEIFETMIVDLAYPQQYENKTIRDLLIENNHACLEESEVTFYEKWKPMEEDFNSVRNSYEIDDDDAVQAIAGYKPTDDSRICKFYAEKGFCWKQEKCNKEHSLVDPDVFTTDKIPVFSSAFNQLEPPLRNSEWKVKVNDVVSLNRFYAHLPSHMTRLHLGEGVHMDLSNLHGELNNPTHARCFKRVTIKPAPGELVLAKHDDYWYRARVQFSDENNGNSFKVFFVDCGTTADVSLVDLRQMDAAFLKLPFQAVLCIITNIIPMEGLSQQDRDNGVAFLDGLLADGKPLVKVIGSEPGDILTLEVLVKTKDKDVGDAMIEAGFCDFKEIVPSKSSSSKVPIPG